jgi:predicted DsbA family dithiol-disulfide isomerase
MATTQLTIYGDFNRPFTALASARVDRLLESRTHELDWRAVQHDTGIPAAGEPVAGELAATIADEVAQIRELSDRDLQLELAVPDFRSNTAAASAAFAAAPAGAPADRLRRVLFSAVWDDGRNISTLADLRDVAAIDEEHRDAGTAARWQDEFDALPKPVTPTLILPDGYVSRGLGALRRLADLVAASSSPS